MAAYRTAEVPFRMMEDGRKYLDSTQLVEEPHLVDFVARFYCCFKFNRNEERLYYTPPEAQ